jgi:hypothetical protein
MAQKLNIDIVARDKTKQALGNVQGALSKVKGAVFNLQNAFIGLGAGLVIRNLVNTGKELENLQVRLKFLLKDTNEGAKAFDNMVKFASKVPFSLEEIQSGSGILATVTDNAEELQKMLEITGNVAAVTGLDFRTTAEQIQRSFSAGIGAADLFREKGVRNMLGFKVGATVSIEDTVLAFEKVFGKGGRFGKATDELAQTFTGTLSMIGDKIFSFKKTILEAGLFESLKKEFGALDKFLEENSKQIDKVAQDIGIALGFAVKKLADAVVVIKNNMNTFKNVIMILISVKVVTLFTNLAIAVTNVAKAMMSFGFATLFTKGGLLGIAKAIAKGGAIFIAFKGMEKLFDDMKNSFEDFSDGVKNSLPDARDLHKVMVQTKKAVFDMAKVEESIAKAKEKELKLQNFLLEEQNKKRLKFNQLINDHKTTSEQVLEKIKEQNSEFSLSNEIFGFINRGIDSFSRGLAESLILGKNIKETFSNMAKTLAVEVLSQLISVIAKKGVELAIEKLITAEHKKRAALSGGGSLFNMARSFLGFAKGGAVAKGQPVVVGERGPEMFVPNSTGQITQSARGTSAGQTTVNFNINTLDASGFDDLLVRNRGTITQIINNAVNERGSKNLI